MLVCAVLGCTEQATTLSGLEPIEHGRKVAATATLGWRMEPRCGCGWQNDKYLFSIPGLHPFRVSSLSFGLSLYCVKCPLREQTVG